MSMNYATYLETVPTFLKAYDRLTISFFFHHLHDHLKIRIVDKHRVDDDEYVKTVQKTYDREWEQVRQVAQAYKDHLLAFLDTLEVGLPQQDAQIVNCEALHTWFMPTLFGAWHGADFVKNGRTGEMVQGLKSGKYQTNTPESARVLETALGSREMITNDVSHAMTNVVRHELDDVMQAHMNKMGYEGNVEEQTKAFLAKVFGGSGTVDL